jgi:excisionase family DNA binding protein
VKRAETPIERKYLSPKEVAGMFGVRAETVLLWLNRGTMKGIKLGGRRLWRISRQEIERFEKGER